MNERKLTGITVLPTFNCDLNCSYCFTRFYNYSRFGVMNKETARATLEFAKKNVAEGGLIWFFGGEPTVAWDVVKFFVEEVRSQGLKFRLGMTTNGYLLDEERLNYLAEKTGKTFGFLWSMDGTKELHDRFRVLPGGKGTWDVVFRNFKLAEKIFGRQPQVRWTFGPGTITGIAEAVKQYVEEYRIHVIALGAVFEAEWSENDYAEFRREMEKLRAYLIGWYRRGIPVNLMPVRDGIVYFTGATGLNDRCGLGLHDVGIMPNGDIAPCHRFCDSLAESDEMKIGDVFNGINREKAELIQRKWVSLLPISEEPELCKTCVARPFCNGGCLSQNFDLFGDMHVVPKSLCRYVQIVVEVFTPMAHLMIREDNKAFKEAYGLLPRPRPPPTMVGQE
jgi:uncharacterized protein